MHARYLNSSLKRAARPRFTQCKLAVCALLLGCASAPRPAPLDASAQASASVQAAKALAPQAFAHAEQLREAAEEAFNAEDSARAELLAQQALVGYRRVQVQVQAVQAAAREAAARTQLAVQRQRLVELERRQEQTAAETTALELKVKVARDAEPRLPLEATSPKREAERLAAARAIGTEAGLLCEAARLLGPPRASLTSAVEQVRTFLDASVRTQPSAALDQAFDLRIRCLQELTEARRRENPESHDAAPDLFLKRLSQAVSEGRVYRDDRGVIVSLMPFDARGQLSNAGRAAVVQLAETARSNPSFPLMVAMHTPPPRKGEAPGSTPAETQRAQTLRATLVSAGGPDIEPHFVSHYSGLPEEALRALNNRKDYVEFIFVTR